MVDALLPETVVDANDTTAQAATVATIAGSRASRRRRSSSSTAAFAAIDGTRRSDLESNAANLMSLGKTLLPGLLSFYNSSADAAARRVTLSVVTKYLGLSPPVVLKPLITTDDTNDGPRFAPFVAGLLGENCSAAESLAGLSLAHFALTKLPEVKNLFAREGVVHEIKRLKDVGEAKAEEERAAVAAAAKASTATAGGGDADGAPGAAGATRSEGAVASFGGLSTGTLPAAATAGATDVAGSSATMAAALQAAGAPRLPLRLAPLRQTVSSGESSAKTVGDVAKAVVAKHLEADMNDDEEADSVFARLTAVARSLTNLAGSNSNGLEGAEALRKLSGILGDSRGISTFELSRSGVVKLSSLISVPRHTQPWSGPSALWHLRRH